MNTEMVWPEAQTEMYDNTRLSAYKTCPRSFFIRHVMHWTKENIAMPLVFGQCWHSAMDVVWGNIHKFPNRKELADVAMAMFLNTWEEYGFDPDMPYNILEMYAPRTPGTAHEMLYNYIHARERMLMEMELVSIEQPFAVPLPRMDNVWYIGKLDKVFSYSGQTLVGEHKSTTAYAIEGGFRTDYLEGWFSDSQVKGYQFGGSMFYPGLSGVWVDAALVHKKIHDSFRIIPVSHQFPLLQEWIGDTVQWATRVSNEVAAFNKVGELVPGMFPKNENSCYGKFGSCPFIDICRSVSDPTKLPGPPGGFREEKWEPFSLLGLDKMVKESHE